MHYCSLNVHINLKITNLTRILLKWLYHIVKEIVNNITFTHNIRSILDLRNYIGSRNCIRFTKLYPYPDIIIILI